MWMSHSVDRALSVWMRQYRQGCVSVDESQYGQGCVSLGELQLAVSVWARYILGWAVSVKVCCTIRDIRRR